MSQCSSIDLRIMCNSKPCICIYTVQPWAIFCSVWRNFLFLSHGLWHFVLFPPDITQNITRLWCLKNSLISVNRITPNEFNFCDNLISIQTVLYLQKEDNQSLLKYYSQPDWKRDRNVYSQWRGPGLHPRKLCADSFHPVPATLAWGWSWQQPVPPAGPPRSSRWMPPRWRALHQRQTSNPDFNLMNYKLAGSLVYNVSNYRGDGCACVTIVYV